MSPEDRESINQDHAHYFFVLLFLLVDSSLLSSAFRFAPALVSFPFPFAPFPLVSVSFPFPTLPLSSFGSLGCTVKKPSRRPCCFALPNFWSFSAPFRTRSSLHRKDISQSGRHGV